MYCLSFIRLLYIDYCMIYQSFYILFSPKYCILMYERTHIRNSFLIKKFIFNYFILYFVVLKGND